MTNIRRRKSEKLKSMGQRAQRIGLKDWQVVNETGMGDQVDCPTSPLRCFLRKIAEKNFNEFIKLL
jgi:hypothetical protein